MNEENQVYILRGSITSTKPKATAYWNSSTHTHTHTHTDTLAGINKIKY